MLTQSSYQLLSDLFFWRKVRSSGAKKFAVPIGLRDLTIRTIVERETKHGKRMVEMRYYYTPKEEMYGEDVSRFTQDAKLSYAPIKSYHVEGKGHIRDFYKRFTAMQPKYLDQLKDLKGKKFKGLVKHVANDSVLDGFQQRMEDGKRRKFWTQEIIAVTHIDNEMDFDYFDLVEFGVQDVVKKKEVIIPF